MMNKKVQAHRGYSDVYPENTMLAFREALQAGAGGIEMDIRRTADRIFVIMHDHTADRTTNGTGRIDQLSYEDYIQHLDAGAWKGARYAGREDTRIPRLAQVLDEFRGSGADLILQLKIGIDDSLDVLNMVTSRGMLQEVIFFGHPDVINVIKEKEPRASTQNDGMPGPDSYEHMLRNAVRHNHHAVSVSPAVTEEMVKAIKQQGKLVHCSFLSSDYDVQVQRLIGLGVDFILGNDPHKMALALTKADRGDVN